jgi:hypothetical protein
MEMRRIETPAARNTDPVTSHEAAEHHTRTGKRAYQQSLTVAAVRAFPGKTGFQSNPKIRRLPKCACPSKGCANSSS